MQYTSRLVLRRLPVLVGVGALLVGAAGPAGGASASAPQGTLVFASNRTGVFQIYSLRADGMELGQLTRGKAADTGPRFSPDGRRIVFARSAKEYVTDLWVMNADGSGQRRLAAGAGAAAWSPDSRRIAYVSAAGRLSIQDVDSLRTVTISGRNVNPYWSPDGRLIAVAHQVGDRGDLAVVRGDGGGSLKTLRRNAAPLGWSPQGEIAFTVPGWQAIGVIRADGRGVRRLLPFAAGGLAWSPDGRRLASVGGELPSNGLHLSSASGAGVRPVGPQGVNGTSSPVWSPDSRWLAYGLDPFDLDELLLVAADGSAVRPLTALVPRPVGTGYDAPSWRPRGATPARLGEAPVAVPSDVVTSTTFAPASGMISELAADGGLAAVVFRAPPLVCAAVEAWEPALKRAVRLHLGCVDHGSLAVAGRRVAWHGTSGGNTLETTVAMATPEQPSELVLADEGAQENGVGKVASRPAGHGGLLAFTVTHRCTDGGGPDDPCPAGLSEGDITDATIWRVGGASRCPDGSSGTTCTLVARADGQLLVLAADARRIVARTDDGVRLLSASGAVLMDFPVEATAAVLSGTRLALRTGSAVEIYDTGSGKLTKRLPVVNAVNLADLAGDILVTTSNSTVTLRRLTDGRTFALHTDGPAKAKLTNRGLFLAGTDRVAFMPQHDVLRRLGG